ncbi:MAG: hypothetical protein IKN08_05965 [Bacteroidales bacterium]|nr:hypothetical protein [Bacteroidales bacterium]
MKKRLWFILVLALTALYSCNKPREQADFDLLVDYQINEGPLLLDTLCYTNEAGNTFLITEVQWFLSNIELKNETGDWTMLHQRGVSDTLDLCRFFYIDTNIPESQTLHAKPVNVGHYNAIRFTFGLDENDNYTGLFNDLPESEMFWPDMMGGGYHYMKLNGKYVNEEGRLAPLAIHLGIGQNEECTQFYQNYFIVEIPIDLTIKANHENQIHLAMVIDNWFRNPHTYDFNVWGIHIMQNQEAQRMLNGNGNDVFKIITQSDNKQTSMKKGEHMEETFRALMKKAAPKPGFWTWQNVKTTIAQIHGKDKEQS